MIATVREYDYDEVKDRIQHLIDVSYSYDQMKYRNLSARILASRHWTRKKNKIQVMKTGNSRQTVKGLSGVSIFGRSRKGHEG